MTDIAIAKGKIVMWNLMFFHTSDKKATVLEMCETETEARAALKTQIDYKTFHGYQMVKVKGMQRWEYLSTVIDAWGFAYYIEYDQHVENERLRGGQPYQA